MCVLLRSILIHLCLEQQNIALLHSVLPCGSAIPHGTAAEANASFGPREISAFALGVGVPPPMGSRRKIHETGVTAPFSVAQAASGPSRVDWLRPAEDELGTTAGQFTPLYVTYFGNN